MNYQERRDVRSPGEVTDEAGAIELAFIAARARGESLAAWLERYPQHARALIDLDSALDADDRAPEPEAEAVAVAVTALRAALARVAGPPAPTPAPGLIARGRALGLGIPQLARRLRLASDLVIKLDRGVFPPATIPRRLCDQLAAVLQYPRATVEAALTRQPVVQAALYYAKRAPEAPRQQSFLDALKQSQDLTPEDRAFWLAAAREEGLVP